MFELTVENAADYLRANGWLEAGPARVEALGWGVSNLVLRVVAPSRQFIVKQSRPQLRTKEAWFSDVERVYRESAAMKLLRPLLPEGVVPEVLFEDRANFLFGMTHAPAGARVWKEQLLAGEISTNVAAFAGRVLGLIHECTAAGLSAELSDRTVFRQLRIEPFYERVRQRRPEVATQMTALIAELEERSEALCHGDFSPKNFLVHPSPARRFFTLVDYETCHLGDPAFDLGFFLSHLILKAVRVEPSRSAFFDLTRKFWEMYGQTVCFRPQAELMQRGIGHFAGCALARIDGTSPVDYLQSESQREAVRRIGRRVLHEQPGSWEGVLGIVAAECRRSR